VLNTHFSKGKMSNILYFPFAVKTSLHNSLIFHPQLLRCSKNLAQGFSPQSHFMKHIKLVSHFPSYQEKRFFRILIVLSKKDHACDPSLLEMSYNPC